MIYYVQYMTSKNRSIFWGTVAFLCTEASYYVLSEKIGGEPALKRPGELNTPNTDRFFTLHNHLGLKLIYPLVNKLVDPENSQFL